jgi:hypothetical protein
MMAEIVIGALGLVLAVLGALAGHRLGTIKGRDDERQKQDADRATDTAQRVQEGRAAVRDGRDRGDIADRLRANDGKW